MEIKRLFFIVFVCFLAQGCDRSPLERWEVDQEIRREIFEQCLKLTPAGPQVTKYNDWAEVIEQCGQQAYYQARYCAENCPEDSKK